MACVALLHLPQSSAQSQDCEDYHDDNYYSILGSAYVLADKYQLAEFQNEVVRAWMRSGKQGEHLRADYLLSILRLAPKTSPIRQLTLQSSVAYIYECDYPWGNVAEDLIAYEAVEELLNYLQECVKTEPFPEHQYGLNWEETMKYLIRE